MILHLPQYTVYSVGHLDHNIYGLVENIIFFFLCLKCKKNVQVLKFNDKNNFKNNILKYVTREMIIFISSV